MNRKLFATCILSIALAAAAGCTDKKEETKPDAKGTTEAVAKEGTMAENESATDSSDDKTETFPGFAYEGCISLNKEAFLEKAGLTEDDLVEDKNGKYDLKETVTIFGHSFTPYVCFDISETDSGLYKVGYICVDSFDDSVKELMAQFKDGLTAVYGQPTTYEGLDTKFSDMAEIPKEGNGLRFGEEWAGNDGQKVNCTFTFLKEKIQICISSGIQKLPGSK